MSRGLSLVPLLCTVCCLACGGDDGVDGSGGDNSGGTPGGGDEEPPALVGTLAAHNQARQALGLDLMTWDSDLARTAQAWADRCSFEHNSGRSDGFSDYVGENIYGTTGTPRGPDAVASWMSEEAFYNYDQNSCSDVCGHYTQIVWRESVRLGCGVSMCGGDDWNLVVCNYAPGGNVNGRRPY